MSTPHTNGPSPEDEATAALLAEAAAIVEDIVECETTLSPRWRRTVRALHGLGLLDIVGRDWVRIGPEGLDFATLTPEQADRLACRLEDLEYEVQPEHPSTPPPSQPVFVFPLPSLPPVAPTSSSHVRGL